ncbi:MAG TPA: glycosyltransferase 87 family protein [Candidatus Sulfotelmatobacter sp.]|jgi:hypothetical protein|nr:glycosyltransferase 87 family protein [Candidatus Sulfotelmatobacter sp.]
MKGLEKLKKKYKLTHRKPLFYLLSLLGVLFLFLGGLITRGYSTLFLFQVNRSDFFMDFYLPLSELFNGPYAHGSIYPPLPALFYKLMLRFVPYNIVTHGAFAIRSSQAGEMVFLFYILVTLLAFFVLIMEVKGGSRLEKYVFSFVTVFSAPFLFQFERANIIFVVLLFLIIYVFFKDSKKSIIQEIALISLSVASAIKLYPIVFLLLLIKEKRFSETIRVVVYTAILFFLPFFALGGLSQLPVLIKNITTTSNGIFAWGVGSSVSMQSITRIIGSLFGNFGATPILIGNIISIIILLLGILVAFFMRSKWKTVALLTLTMILVPSISFEYTLIFMLIPLIMFLDREEKKKKNEYIYTICFVLIFTPFLFGNVDSINSGFGPHARPLTYEVLIQNIALVTMTILLLVKESISLRKIQ